MRDWIRPPFGTAVAAHVLAWAFAAIFIYEVAVVAGEPTNFIALVAISSPVLLSAITLLCAARLSCRTLAWVIAWMVLAVCIVGIASIGLFLSPIAGLMFWTANEIPDSDW